MSRWIRPRRGRGLVVLAIAVAALLAVATAGAYVGTDGDDYPPGSVVTISGGNDAGGVPGYVAGNAVQVDVAGPNGWTAACETTVESDGSWSCEVTLSDDPAVAQGDYTYTANSTDANGDPISETGSFTDATNTFPECGIVNPIVVDTTVDELIGNSTCSLREAILNANGDAAADTITLPAGTYNLTSVGSGDLDVTNPLTINGAGAATTIVNQTVNDERVFDVTDGDSLTLTGMTVSGGRENSVGGGILSLGNLTLTDVVVTSNVTTTDDDDGGGIYFGNGSSDTLTLTNVTVSNNTAARDSNDNANGGGIYIANGTATLTNVVVDGNLAREDGGDGRGGGIYFSAGNLTLTDVTVSDNTSEDDGGGIYNDDDDLTVNRATLSGNEAGDDGGGIYFNDSASLTNVTVSGNSADDDGGGMRINNSGNTATLTNVTITLNTADGSGDGVQDDDGAINARNTIIAGNPGTDCGGDDPGDGGGTIPNLESGTSCGFTIQNADPLLGPLALNAPGSTETHALGAGSPAINAASATYAPDVDQRGVARPQGAADDIGAYEYEAVAATGTLTVEKELENAAGKSGNKSADDFQFDVSGGPSVIPRQTFEADGSNDLTVDPDDYTVEEVDENGYTATYENDANTDEDCDDLTIAAGDTVTCTITNTFVGYGSSTATQVSSTSIVIGNSISDTATVTGDAEGGDPGGNVDFYLCGPTDPSLAYVACTTGGTKVKNDAALVGNGDDTADVSYTVPASTLTKAGKYCMLAVYEGDSLYQGSQDDGSTNECFTVTPAPTTVVYSGATEGVEGVALQLKASVTSAYEPCVILRQVTFTLDGVNSDPGPFMQDTSAPTTGTYTRYAMQNVVLDADAYDVVSSVAAVSLNADAWPECQADNDESDAVVLLVAQAGSAAHGGGWYKADGSVVPLQGAPRVNDGFTIKREDDGTYKGQILWKHQNHNRLKGILDGYGVIDCPTADYFRCGIVTGTGTLFDWDSDTETWVNPRTVSFIATFYDGGLQPCAKKKCTKQERPDWFGMKILDENVQGESTAPIQLSGGSIKAGDAA